MDSLEFAGLKCLRDAAGSASVMVRVALLKEQRR